MKKSRVGTTLVANTLQIKMCKEWSIG